MRERGRRKKYRQLEIKREGDGGAKEKDGEQIKACTNEGENKKKPFEVGVRDRIDIQ